MSIMPNLKAASTQGMGPFKDAIVCAVLVCYYSSYGTRGRCEGSNAYAILLP